MKSTGCDEVEERVEASGMTVASRAWDDDFEAEDVKVCIRGRERFAMEGWGVGR